MKYSATILALISASAVINAKVLSKQSLAQTSATLSKSAPSGLDPNILWAPKASNGELTDAFGNTYHQEDDYWYFHDPTSDSTTNVYADHVEQTHGDGSSLTYTFDGETTYDDGHDNVFESHADGTEEYYAANGDYVLTRADGLEQHFYQAQGDEIYDLYHYGENGSQEWYQDVTYQGDDFEGDMWYWDQPNYKWCYYFADTDTWACVGDEGIGCLETPLHNRVCYNKYNDEWLYADMNNQEINGFDNFQFFYYPEWAWGTDDQEWYLWDDLHDAWVVAAS